MRTQLDEQPARRERSRALREAGALGDFRRLSLTSMAVANVEETGEDLDLGFVAKMRAKTGKSLKRAFEKSSGTPSRIRRIGVHQFINQTIAKVKQQFVRLHEAGYGLLPWQRPMYEVLEGCDQSLDAATAELFDREANTFASEVLFPRGVHATAPGVRSHPCDRSADFNACLRGALRVEPRCSRSWGAAGSSRDHTRGEGGRWSAIGLGGNWGGDSL